MCGSLGALDNFIMELIRTIRERSQTRREQDVQQEMQSRIAVLDFADSLYIAYDGVPLVLIQEDWTPKDILERLNSMRQVAANSKLNSITNFYKLEDDANRSESENQQKC